MPSTSIDVAESILVSPPRLAQTQILPYPDDPYVTVQRSTVDSSSAWSHGPQTLPASPIDHPSSSRQLTLHQVLARASTSRSPYRTTARMSVRSPPPPIQIPTYSLSSSSPTSLLCRRARSPTSSPVSSPSQRRRRSESYSEEEESDPSEDEDVDMDPPEEEEEDVVPDDALVVAQSPAHSVHSDEPDSPPLSPLPFVPAPPAEMDVPPLSPGSDVPSVVSSEAAEHGEIGRIWERLLAHGTRIRELAVQLGDESAKTIDDLRDDMAFVLGRIRELREELSEFRGHMDSLQRGFLTARDADRKLWERATALEREVMDLKRDRDSQGVEIASMWREIKSLQDELRVLRQSRG